MDATHAHGARTHGDRRPHLKASLGSGRSLDTTPRELDSVTPRIRDCVLLEFLGNGTRPEDARERARTLASRAGSHALLVGAADLDDASNAEPATIDPDGWRDALTRALAATPRATLVLAGDEAIERGAALGGASTVRTWRTALCGDATLDREALDHAIAAQPLGVSSRDSLWDGDHLVVPGVPDDAAVELVIAAFAHLAEDLPSLDLVFLGDAPQRLVGLADDLGVTWRVHWAGPAPLRAECTWLAGASAIVVTDREAAHPSLIVRALAAGTPLVTAGGGARVRNLHAWLGASGVGALALPQRPADLAATLQAALATGDAARLARERAQRVARAHEATRALARLLGLEAEKPARKLAA